MVDKFEVSVSFITPSVVVIVTLTVSLLANPVRSQVEVQTSTNEV